MTTPPVPHAVPAPPRMLALWVPDWPVLAAMSATDLDAHIPAAIYDGNRITVASAPARAAGVRRGMRKRTARELCPPLELLLPDVGRDTRLFELVTTAAEQIVANPQVCRPGLLLTQAHGPTRFHGDEHTLIELVSTTVTNKSGYECQVGIGDGTLAAILAARDQTVIPPGKSSNYLNPKPLTETLHATMTPERIREVTDLIDLLERLGIRTIQDLTALPGRDVAARFGPTGTWLHKLVHAQDLQPPALNRPQDDLMVETTLDPPADRIDTAAFAARRLAENLHDELINRAASCERIQITAQTESGRSLTRTWRTDEGAVGALTTNRITDRVRWQLEGWLTNPTEADVSTDTPDPLTRLALTAHALLPVGAHQGRFWGRDTGTHLKAQRACERVQALLGIDAVLSPTLQGGRGLRDQVQLTPWGEQTQTERPRNAPWPGKLPQPFPATVLPKPQPVNLLDNQNRPVIVDRRLRMSAPPAALEGEGHNNHIHTWAGPWPNAQRWWRQDAERSIYLQVILTTGQALLLAGAQGTWTLEAHYD